MMQVLQPSQNGLSSLSWRSHRSLYYRQGSRQESDTRLLADHHTGCFERPGCVGLRDA